MDATQKRIADDAQKRLGPRVFAIVAGLFFFVALVKFGTPVILDNILLPPENAQAAVFESWQLKWGYWMMLPLFAAGLAAVRGQKLSFSWMLILPLVWLAWQFIAASQSVGPMLMSVPLDNLSPEQLARLEKNYRMLRLVTLEHFSACVALFYLGYFTMRGVRSPWPVWTGIALALCWILHAGLEQHFGGLEATRRMVASMKESVGLPAGILNDPDYQKKIASNRIFSTFSSPDALAGCIILLLPMTLVFLWQLTPKVRTSVRRAFVVILGGCGLACLYWSGSKAGWLVTLIVAVVALGHSAIATKWKRILICGVLVCGVAGFGLRYAGFFQKEKNSMGARFAYWRAALKIVEMHPLLGTGPGTFSIFYGQLKRPDDEATKLCHNDYLEQACDSGLPGFLVYTGMIVGYLWWLYRYRTGKSVREFTIFYAVWLGVAGLCLHSVVEYHLYVPSLMWPMFFLLGWAMSLMD